MLHQAKKPITYHRWSKEQLELLEKLRGQASVTEIARRLGLTRGKVRHKIRQLKEAERKGEVVSAYSYVRHPKKDTTFSEMLFLHYLIKMADRCKELGMKPNVNLFLEEYRKMRFELEQTPFAQHLRLKMEENCPLRREKAPSDPPPEN